MTLRHSLLAGGDFVVTLRQAQGGALNRPKGDHGELKVAKKNANGYIKM